ncbi:hypothetical protein N7478_013167 [Penicillium angulare]|uniref:uncharacterized protein n=1 Tax=Penicillium angulare TaxID=116970 RepID=UPI0025423008|nr:uncharacterized protein N7478_013167 [Penicillium angulare]KAJ5257063.1 hypothetical protein N7478_013167 [Penicillium angulare]
MVEWPPYTPATSLGIELAIIFVFIAAMIGTIAIYTFFWKIHQRRNHEEHLARRKAFQSRAGCRANEFNFDLQLGHIATVTSGASMEGISNEGTLVGSPSGWSGWETGAGAVHEKMLDRGVPSENMIELPTHGMEFVSANPRRGVEWKDRW